MSIDPLEMLLRMFHLPTMAASYAPVMAQAEEGNWGYRKFLLHLCEAEAADRKERKQERLLKQSGLPAGKTLRAVAVRLGYHDSPPISVN